MVRRLGGSIFRVNMIFHIALLYYRFTTAIECEGVVYPSTETFRQLALFCHHWLLAERCLPYLKYVNPFFFFFLFFVIVNKIKMPCPFLIVSQSNYLIQVVKINWHTEWQTVQIQISWLLQKPTDLDLHCLQSQGISRFSKTRVNTPV